VERSQEMERRYAIGDKYSSDSGVGNIYSYDLDGCLGELK